jgi:molybdate transport system ATP-binding protein
VYGPSGAGKSMLLKAIAGLHHPDAGHIRLDGRSLFDSTQGICLSPQQRQLGYLFQDYALFPHLSVRQNIGFGLQARLAQPRPPPSAGSG